MTDLARILDTYGSHTPPPPTERTPSMRVIIAATLLALLYPLLAAPANAALLGGSIAHYSPDAGHDAPIIVWCDDRQRRIPEGVHSDTRCDDEDVDKVWIRHNEELWCWEGRAGYLWQQKFLDAHGWRNVYNIENKSCTLRRD